MVVSIGNDVLPNAVDSNAGEAVKLTLTAAVLTELLNEYSVGVKHLKK